MSKATKGSAGTGGSEKFNEANGDKVAQSGSTASSASAHQGPGLGLVTIEGRTLNTDLLGKKPSIYALLRAYVLNDGNNLRGDHQSSSSSSSSQGDSTAAAVLPPTPKVSPNVAFAPDARRTATLNESIVGKLTTVPTYNILYSHVQYFKNLNKWYRNLFHRNSHAVFQERLGILKSQMNVSALQQHLRQTASKQLRLRMPQSNPYLLRKDEEYAVPPGQHGQRPSTHKRKPMRVHTHAPHAKARAMRQQVQAGAHSFNGPLFQQLIQSAALRRGPNTGGLSPGTFAEVSTAAAAITAMRRSPAKNSR